MDKYDLEIAHLKMYPDEIYEHWEAAKPLFQFCGSRGDNCGCLTMVYGCVKEAETEELTRAIRKDHRLPSRGSDIVLEDLPVFA